MGIQNLSQGTISGASQIPFFDPTNGVDRRDSVNDLIAVITDGFVPAGGILAISSVYALRITTPRVQALTTAYINVPNYEAGIKLPDGASSLAQMLVAGEYVATRDIQAVQFWIGLSGTYPTNRDLTVAVLVGSDAAPFESAFRFVGAGRGGGAPVTANLSGIASNLNNPFGMIKAGEKVRLVLKFNVADNLSLDRLSFAVQTLDGS